MVDVVFYEVIFVMMESMVLEFDVFGFICECIGNIMLGIIFFFIYISVDGCYVQIGVNGDVIFCCFMQVIGCDDLVSDL